MADVAWERLISYAKLSIISLPFNTPELLKELQESS